MNAIAWIVGSAFLVLFVSIVVLSVYRRDALVRWQQDLQRGAPDVTWPDWNSSWPALPPRPAAVTEDMRGAYAFAALRAETLRHIPCYCGCVSEGHHSVLSCFVIGFKADGVPIWNPHGFTCPMCVDIVREVMLMTSRGMSLPVVRSEIDDRHESLFSRPTRTPNPH